MIKDIVVNLSVGEAGAFASDYAVSVASELDARTWGELRVGFADGAP